MKEREGEKQRKKERMRKKGSMRRLRLLLIGEIPPSLCLCLLANEKRANSEDEGESRADDDPEIETSIYIEIGTKALRRKKCREDKKKRDQLHERKQERGGVCMREKERHTVRSEGFLAVQKSERDKKNNGNTKKETEEEKEKEKKKEKRSLKEKEEEGREREWQSTVSKRKNEEKTHEGENG
ncbi:hypothetical protein CSUI_008839 [Cystoisospora suis]|uniref:Uncharacterized protein n=1 Tax=Cystoisospora suis TaxID=483139 RepID=A0A2C6KL25_9APIC|nr:hypothetical protein CSUI_008839 [Cystoisospora suis]